MAVKPRSVSSKWTKTKALLRNKLLRAHVPATYPMNRSTLRTMLDRYQMVYVKPDVGTCGNGVIRVEKRNNGGAVVYGYQAGTTARSFRAYEPMYASLLRAKANRVYLVQKGIRMLTHQGRRFDLRVMVQQNPRGKWEVTGIIGRMAHPGKIVTNYHNGGTPLKAGVLLQGHTTAERRTALLRKTAQVGLETADQMNRAFPGIREVGLDIALDQNLHPWILEVNTRPDPFIFNAIRDKTMYRKVIRCARANGRFLKRRNIRTKNHRR